MINKVKSHIKNVENFNKILISPTGNVQKFFGSMSSPDSEKVRNSIEEILP